MGKLKYTNSLIRDIIGFAMANKAWWVVPVVLVLLATAALAVFTSGVAPYIYALF